MAAGKLRTPIRLHRRAAKADDKYGRANAGAYAVAIDLEWARLTPKQGGEVALASRLEGRQAYELLVRRTPSTAQITAEDRIETLDDLALTIEVTSAAPFQADPSYILITGETGGAANG
jgi:head-tail adaptor